ncbi:OmpA family protein [Sorangium sp. So ce1335]|uniref:OmpA family protein n=1 Tax=Sorangium sp. So ce1335 TaxID=3133335 RepID=UPI003F5F657C
MMSTFKLPRALLGALALSLLAACAAPPAPAQSAAAEPRLPHPGRDGVYKVEWPDLREGEDRFIGLTLGADIADVCRLPKTHFAFDAAEPLPQEHLELRAVVDCLLSSNLKDARIELIGRADPRGAQAYNQDLSLRRASRVKEILVKEGIPADRITTRATGAAEAVGTQPMYSYGYDRRVDVVLLGVAHAPAR